MTTSALATLKAFYIASEKRGNVSYRMARGEQQTLVSLTPEDKRELVRLFEESGMRIGTFASYMAEVNTQEYYRVYQRVRQTMLQVQRERGGAGSVVQCTGQVPAPVVEQKVVMVVDTLQENINRMANELIATETEMEELGNRQQELSRKFINLTNNLASLRSAQAIIEEIK